MYDFLKNYRLLESAILGHLMFFFPDSDSSYISCKCHKHLATPILCRKMKILGHPVYVENLIFSDTLHVVEEIQIFYSILNLQRMEKSWDTPLVVKISTVS